MLFSILCPSPAPIETWLMKFPCPSARLSPFRLSAVSSPVPAASSATQPCPSGCLGRSSVSNTCLIGSRSSTTCWQDVQASSRWENTSWHCVAAFVDDDLVTESKHLIAFRILEVIRCGVSKLWCYRQIRCQNSRGCCEILPRTLKGPRGCVVHGFSARAPSPAAHLEMRFCTKITGDEIE